MSWKIYYQTLWISLVHLGQEYSWGLYHQKRQESKKNQGLIGILKKWFFDTGAQSLVKNEKKLIVTKYQTNFLWILVLKIWFEKTL